MMKRISGLLVLAFTVIRFATLPCVGASIVCAEAPSMPLRHQDQSGTNSSSTQGQALTVEQVDARLAEIEADASITDEVKARLKEQLGNARNLLVNADTVLQQAQLFEAQAQSAESDLSAIQTKLDSAEPAYDFESATSAELPKLADDVQRLQKALNDNKADLEATLAEPAKRAQRRAVIPGLLLENEALLAEIKKALAESPDAATDLASHQAKRLFDRARQVAAEATDRALRAEMAVYEAHGDTFLPLKTQWLTRKVKQQDQDLEQLRLKLEERRRKDAVFQLREGESILASMPPELKEFGESVVRIASRRVEVVGKITSASRLSGELQTKLGNVSEIASKTEDRIDQGVQAGLGLMLMRQKDQLPDLSSHRYDLNARKSELRELQIWLYELQDRSTALSRTDEARDKILDELQREYPNASSEPWIPAIEQVLALEKRIHASLIVEVGSYFDLLNRASQTEAELIAVTDEYATLIEENLFWVHTAPPFSKTNWSQLPAAISWLLDPQKWSQVGVALLRDARRDLLPAGCFLIVFVALVAMRRKARRRIHELGQTAARRTCRTFMPTVQSFLLTLLLATPLPLAWGYVAWRLSVSAIPFGSALSNALLILLYYVAFIELLRQALRRKGLAESHFGWPIQSVRLIRRGLIWQLTTVVPLLTVAALFMFSNKEPYNVTLGRSVFVLAAALAPLILLTVSRFHSTLDLPLLLSDGARGRLYWLFLAAVATVPLVIGLSCAWGYYYTAWHFFFAFLEALLLILAFVLIAGFLYRWVRIRRRQLRFKQLSERMSQPSAASTDSAGSEFALAVEGSVDLDQIDGQSKKMIRNCLVAIALVGLWMVAYDVLPALSFVTSIRCWPNDGSYVTLDQVILGVLVIGLTFATARDLPGVLEIALSREAGLDAPGRYATAKLMQYGVAVLGLAIGFSLFGLGWSKVQWLAAGLGVGVGFGLQEIVANFISGIVLLFERPVRVGDVVTVGDTTGVVTRIEIRATTIRNWDRQDLVIPNKDLITGRVLNWTLSGSINRIVIRVGVAYGTNLKRAREVLNEILSRNENVLNEPAPIITLEELSDSAVTFVLRVYLEKVDDRLKTIDALHCEILARFAAEGIEIPFPQRDLHVRSADSVFRTESSIPGEYSAK